VFLKQQMIQVSNESLWVLPYIPLGVGVSNKNWKQPDLLDIIKEKVGTKPVLTFVCYKNIMMRQGN
jgi:hypothetical protein